MKRTLTMMLGIFTALLLLWLMRRALPLFAPFLPALALAIVIEPAVGGMGRRGVRRSIAAGLVTAITLGLCLAALLFFAAEGTRLVTVYAKKAPRLLILLTDTTHSIRQSLDGLMGSLPQETAHSLNSMMDGMTARLSELPVWLSQQALESMTAFAKASPDGLLFVCTAVISVYFFSLYLQDLGSFFVRQLSEPTLQQLKLVGTVLREAAGGYLKVQCILSGITLLILLLSFSLMGIKDSFPAAAAIAVIDALPILGAGAVLLPWALIALALGKVPRALCLLVIYGILLEIGRAHV